MSLKGVVGEDQGHGDRPANGHRPSRYCLNAGKGGDTSFKVGSGLCGSSQDAEQGEGERLLTLQDESLVPREVGHDRDAASQGSQVVQGLGFDGTALCYLRRKQVEQDGQVHCGILELSLDEMFAI